MKDRAFTLIEMAAVIAIMGILAGAAVLTLAHTASEHRFESLCEELERSDGLVRTAARQGGERQQLIFDLNNGMVLWQQNAPSTPLELVRLGQRDTLKVKAVDQEFTTGQVAIDCSSCGLSQTYALQLTRSPADPRWMIVAGMTGRVYWTSDEKQVDTVFDSLATHGLHAAAVEGPNDDEAYPSDDAH